MSKFEPRPGVLCCVQFGKTFSLTELPGVADGTLCESDFEGGKGDAAKGNSRFPRSRSRLICTTPLKFNGLAGYPPPRKVTGTVELY